MLIFRLLTGREQRAAASELLGVVVQWFWVAAGSCDV